MARPLRIEFPGAIYHVMSRGNARQTVFRDDSDYQRLIKGLETVVGRLGWDLLCFVLMPNHFHLLVRTPRPNLSRGMQHLTSGYANWCSRRHRRPGHTFQGRFKSELIEDESYLPWHRRSTYEPARQRGECLRALLARVSTCKDAKLSYRGNTSGPSAATSTSIPCGANARSPITRALALVELSGLRPPAAARWMGGLRGFAFGLAWRVGRQRSPEAAYRRFVEQGLARAPANPFQSAAHGWLLGSETFIERMRSLLSEPRNQDEVPAARQLASLDAAIVLAEVARYYGVDQDCFQVRRSGLLGRDLAAWLVRHHSSATLQLPWHRRSSYEPDAPARGVPQSPRWRVGLVCARMRNFLAGVIAPIFGLNHPDSVNHLVRRVDRALARSSELREDIGMTQRILEQRRHGSS